MPVVVVPPPLSSLGTACSSNSDCGSGFCTDGVCCDSACGQTCYACNQRGSRRPLHRSDERARHKRHLAVRWVRALLPAGPGRERACLQDA